MDKQIEEILLRLIPPQIALASTPEGETQKVDVSELKRGEAKAAIQQLVATEVTVALLKLKEDMQMHTVPEGRHLITRSYLNQSIDFMVARQKESK